MVWLSLDDALVDRVDPALDSVTRQLGTVALSDADDDLDMTIHLPDGSGHVVRLMQDDDDAFRITPEIRRLIECASRASLGTEGALDDPAVTPAHRRKALAS